MDYITFLMSALRVITPNVSANPIMCGEFREGRSYTNWRPRGSGDWLLIFTCGGAGRARVEDVEARLSAGTAILYGPGAAQEYFTDDKTGRWHLRWAHFTPRPHWQPWLRWPEMARGVGQLQLTGPVLVAAQEALRRMLAAHAQEGMGKDDMAMNALEEALLWIFKLNSDARLASLDSRVQEAARYMAAHPDQPFDLRRVAAHCGLSSSRLSHLFRREQGMSLQRYSEQVRLRLAAQLLAQTNLPVGAIARETGFADPLYFSRRFRRHHGKPPSAWR
jgi:AraC family transcriptional regulator, arabinose operon regulatory protein